MERKIGEIFEYNGEWYQCVGGTCRNCSFYYDTVCKNITTIGSTNFGNCHCSLRTDHKSVIFKKLEKVGEPMKIHNRLVLKVKADAYNCMRCCFYSKAKCELTIQECERYDCGEGTKFIEINKEDMEEKNNAKHSNFEKIGKNLKEFNFEAAKSGKPVCTRDGRKVRIICFDAKGDKPIIALIEMGVAETPNNYPIDGKAVSTKENPCDLMMLPEKKEGWVNVYKDSVYDTKEEDLTGKSESRGYIDTIKISWEE